jgi:hypothetical protein
VEATVRKLVRLAAAALSLVLAVGAVEGALAMRAGAGDTPVLRDCRSSVYGDLGRRWLPSSVVAGPLAFVRARAYATSPYSFRGAGAGRYWGNKLLVVVRTGWVARVIVPSAQRRKVALQYAPEDFNKAVVPAESEHDVTFAACPPRRPFLGPASARWTQFNGAIVVAGRRCVRLAVYAAKQGHPLPDRALRARLSFGAGSCHA